MKKIGIILLAAGAGKRFGGNKLEAVVGEKPMYMYAMELISKQSKLCPAVVVTGNSNIASEARRQYMDVAENLNPDFGISHSIHLGMKMMLEKHPDMEAVMFMVCDQPWLTHDTLERMIKTFNQGILSLEYEGKRGNPVIFSRDYFQELMHLTGDIGGRQVICKYKEAVNYLKAFNQKELCDIDRKEQIEE